MKKGQASLITTVLIILLVVVLIGVVWGVVSNLVTERAGEISIGQFQYGADLEYFTYTGGNGAEVIAEVHRDNKDNDNGEIIEMQFFVYCNDGTQKIKSVNKGDVLGILERESYSLGDVCSGGDVDKIEMVFIYEENGEEFRTREIGGNEVTNPGNFNINNAVTTFEGAVDTSIQPGDDVVDSCEENLGSYVNEYGSACFVSVIPQESTQEDMGVLVSSGCNYVANTGVSRINCPCSDDIDCQIKYSGEGLEGGVVGECINDICVKKNLNAVEPVPVFDSISAGYFNTCGILTNGSAMCWGDNSKKQLGNDGGYSSSNKPYFVNLPYNFSKIDIMNYHACGILTNGSAVCWGWNDNGQLGHGVLNHETEKSPVFVKGDYEFLDISVGFYHSCGILTNGSAVCWGDNDYNYLGVDSSIKYSDIPIFVNTDSNFSSISVGQTSTCGILTNGSAVCWGMNTNDFLVDNGENAIYPPRILWDGSKFSYLSLGAQNICGTLLDGSEKCWGYDYWRHRPWLNITHDFSDISMGLSNNICGILTNGFAMCWGDNDYGQAGQGDEFEPDEFLNESKFVYGDHKFSSISAGTYHACGILTNGSAMCWGRNDDGRLGDGTNEDKKIPVFVSLPF